MSCSLPFHHVALAAVPVLPWDEGLRWVQMCIRVELNQTKNGLFAHLKRILRLGRLRLRGPRCAQDEFTLAAIAQNLRRLAKLVARPPPALAAARAA